MNNRGWTLLGLAFHWISSWEASLRLPLSLRDK
jgi:hypothetical protein